MVSDTFCGVASTGVSAVNNNNKFKGAPPFSPSLLWHHVQYTVAIVVISPCGDKRQ